MNVRTPRRGFLFSSAAAVAAATLRSTPGPAGEAAASGDPAVIDTHVHVWTDDTDRYPLRPGVQKSQMAVPSFTAEELFRHCRPCGVGRVVLIQMSYYGPDNRYMLDTIARYPREFVGIALIDSERPASAQMRSLAGKGVRGVRIAPGGKKPDQWLETPQMREAWAAAADQGLVLCALVNPEFLPALDSMCATFPRTSLAIDHMARIGAGGPIQTAEVDALCRLARHANTYVKVSAFYALGAKQAPYLDLAPMIARLRSAYGSQRLMWGSDAPFQVRPPHNYRDSIELLRSRLDFLTADDRAWIMGRAAEKVFRF